MLYENEQAASRGISLWQGLRDTPAECGVTWVPGNGACWTCVGMLRQRADGDIMPCVQVEERRGDLNAALKLFNQAVGLSQENALVRYHRAKILISMKKYQVSNSLHFAPPRLMDFPCLWRLALRWVAINS